MFIFIIINHLVIVCVGVCVCWFCLTWIFRFLWFCFVVFVVCLFVCSDIALCIYYYIGLFIDLFIYSFIYFLKE